MFSRQARLDTPPGDGGYSARTVYARFHRVFPLGVGLDIRLAQPLHGEGERHREPQ